MSFLKHLFGKRKISPENKLKQLVKELQGYKWDNFPEVANLIQPAVELGFENDTQPSLGGSRHGGYPDLPTGTEWPRHKGIPMVFIAQLNLTDLAQHHAHEYLPLNGMLYFFCYFPEPENEFGAEHPAHFNNGEYKVLFAEESVELTPSRFPEDLTKTYRFKSQRIHFEPFFQLPPSLEHGIVDESNLSDHDKELIEEHNEVYDDYMMDQVLGIPPPMQGGADWDWAFVYSGMSFEEYEDNPDPVLNLRSKFINLLSIPNFEVISDWQLYFGIHIDDLRKRSFEKAVLIAQGT
ncbi:MAG: DUF1963 domain-containing protein [Bacteroidia bacterium]|nr:DUF1963 domain-containing protein [Bacteroidia bacterium]